MSERKLKLSFNTAITGINPEDGAFDDKQHKAQVLPLRGRVIQTDGITGMFIARYGMEVNYLDEIVDTDTVFAAVQRAIDELVEQEGSTLFPLRGDKVPTVEIDRPAPPEPSFIKTLVVSLPTDLTAYTKDDGYWGRAKLYLGERLANRDGVRGYGVFLREVRVAFDTRTTSVATMRRHVRGILVNLPEVEEWPWNGEGERPLNFFPFLHRRQLRPSYSVVEGVIVS